MLATGNTRIVRYLALAILVRDAFNPFSVCATDRHHQTDG